MFINYQKLLSKLSGNCDLDRLGFSNSHFHANARWAISHGFGSKSELLSPDIIACV